METMSMDKKVVFWDGASRPGVVVENGHVYFASDTSPKRKRVGWDPRKCLDAEKLWERGVVAITEIGDPSGLTPTEMRSLLESAAAYAAVGLPEFVGEVYWHHPMGGVVYRGADVKAAFASAVSTTREALVEHGIPEVLLDNKAVLSLGEHKLPPVVEVKDGDEVVVDVFGGTTFGSGGGWGYYIARGVETLRDKTQSNGFVVVVRRSLRMYPPSFVFSTTGDGIGGARTFENVLYVCK